MLFGIWRWPWNIPYSRFLGFLPWNVANCGTLQNQSRQVTGIYTFMSSLASCLRLLKLCSPLLLLLGITASSCTGSFQLIPAFRKGWIFNHITAGKFNKASSDQTIEQPINKDLKSRGNLEEFIWNRNHLEDHYIDVQYKDFLVVLWVNTTKMKTNYD